MIAHRDIQRERLFYLEFLALFTGQVSRKDLVTRFGISEPAATKDLSLYAELAPGMLQYDLRQKCYVLTDGRPYFDHDIDQSLYSLAGERAIAMDTEHAKRLPSWVNCSIKRQMSLPEVSTITRCMFQGLQMTANYVSTTSGARNRLLSPLALVNDGSRWHIRCFDHDLKQFRDYNMTRFTKVEPGGPSNVDLSSDKAWNMEVTLKLVPHPRAEHPETIRLDYDIRNDALQLTLRACLVGYFLRFWHIDFSDGAMGNPKAQQLFLTNKNELIGCELPSWTFDS